MENFGHFPGETRPNLLHKKRNEILLGCFGLSDIILRMALKVTTTLGADQLIVCFQNCPKKIICSQSVRKKIDC